MKRMIRIWLGGVEWGWQVGWPRKFCSLGSTYQEGGVREVLN